MRRPRSEEEVAKGLAAAVESYAAEGRGSPSLPQAVTEGLDALLYGYGGDGVLELSVSQPQSFACITILGIVIWVEEQTLNPLEATFRIDKAGAVRGLTLRAGDGRVSPSDAPRYPQSWRNLLRIIETRPSADEDWAHVLQYEFH